MKYLRKNESLFIEFISKKFTEGKRPHELILLKLILSNENNLINKLKEILNTKYNISFSNLTKNNLINIMTGEFLTG